MCVLCNPQYHCDRSLYFTLPQKQYVCLHKSAAEGVRHTYIYACPTADDLLHLDEQLKKIKSDFQEKLPTVEGPSPFNLSEQGW